MLFEWIWHEYSSPPALIPDSLCVLACATSPVPNFEWMKSLRPNIAILFALILCLLSGCTGMLARNLDWLAVRYMGGYFDLSDRQTTLLYSLVEDSAQRSANNSLPAVLSLFDQVLALNKQGQLADRIDELAPQFEALGEHFAEDNRDNLIQFAQTIDDEQREQIAAELSQRNDKYHKKHVIPGEHKSRKSFCKDARRNTKRWMGRLNTEQNVAMAYYCEHYRLNEAQWLESRKAWQSEFLATLALTDPQLKATKFSQLIEQPESFFSAKQRSDSEYNTQLSIELLESVIGSSSAKQKDKMQSEILKLRKRVQGFQQALLHIGSL